jgi:hypothetical protein
MSWQSDSQTIQRLHNTMELVSPLPVRHNHIQVCKGFGQAHDALAAVLHPQKQ